MQIVVTFTISFFLSFTCFAQEIAFTFDDAPSGDGPIFTATERSSRIIETLRKHRVEQAAFFLITSHINDEGEQRLKQYGNAGHLLGNHSHTHSWTHAIGTAAYIRDIQVADSILNALELSPRPWYRYPFLDEGSTNSSRDSIRAALNALALRNAYITIDNYDWFFDNAVAKAVANNIHVNFDTLKTCYLEHIWNSIQFYDNIARKVLGRSPKHILLLHENDLAALFLDDLLQLLKDRNWKIISPEEAYTDPIANENPDVLFNDQGRIGAIGFANGWKRDSLVQQSEDVKYLEQLIKDRKVFE